MLPAQVQSATEIHPAIKFWTEIAKDMLESLAVIVGGLWAYFVFLRGRTFKHRLESSVNAGIELRHGKHYLIVHSKLKNVGSSKVKLDSDESGIAIYPGESKGLGEAEVSEVRWHDRAMFNVFGQHSWIEPTETISDALVVELPKEPLPLYKIELIAVNKTWLRTAQNWCTAVIADHHSEEATKAAKMKGGM